MFFSDIGYVISRWIRIGSPPRIGAMGVGMKTVLLVDDGLDENVLFREACRKAKVSFRLQVLSDGASAIAYLSGKEAYANRHQFPMPDLVLLDLKMPKVGGLEVLRWIRQQPHLKSMPVTIFSSSTHPTDLERAYDLRVNSYLVKSVDFEALVQAIAIIERYWLNLNCPPPFGESEARVTRIGGNTYISP